MAKKSHHFRGIAQYTDKLMDLAEGQPVSQGRGQKPSNKEVHKAIADIEKCQKERAHGSFSLVVLLLVLSAHADGTLRLLPGKLISSTSRSVHSAFKPNMHNGQL